MRRYSGFCPLVSNKIMFKYYYCVMIDLAADLSVYLTKSWLVDCWRRCCDAVFRLSHYRVSGARPSSHRQCCNFCNRSATLGTCRSQSPFLRVDDAKVEREAAWPSRPTSFCSAIFMLLCRKWNKFHCSKSLVYLRHFTPQFPLFYWSITELLKLTN